MCNFKTFLYRYLLPTLGLAFISACLVYFLFERYIILGTEQADAGKLHRFLQTEKMDEIPIFGSSRAVGGFIPCEIDDRCFNYGYVATGNSLMICLLRIELEKKRHTPIIMNLDLGGFQYASGNLNKFIPNIGHPLIREYVGTQYHWSYSVPILRYYSIYESLLTGWLSDKVQLTKYVQNGCAIEKNSSALSKEALDNVARRYTWEEIEPGEKEFAEVMDLLKSTDRQILFVIAPTYGTNLFPKEMVRKKYAALCNKLTSCPNVKVYDCLDLLQDKDDFFNTSHLSLSGARKFSRHLRQLLIRDKIL